MTVIKRVTFPQRRFVLLFPVSTAEELVILFLLLPTCLTVALRVHFRRVNERELPTPAQPLQHDFLPGSGGADDEDVLCSPTLGSADITPWDFLSFFPHNKLAAIGAGLGGR